MLFVFVLPAQEWHKIAAKCHAASSEFNPEYSCDRAVDGSLEVGHNKGEWSARKYEGVNAWIQLTFPGLYQINYTRIMQRFKSVEQFKDIELIFDPNTKVQVGCSVQV